jgi:predicted N-acetyltransferase YhbS
MNITFRHYGRPGDFDRVGNFLVENHRPGNQDGNWLQPTWEYMHSHPALDTASLSRIGIWEDGEKVAAVAHYESALGDAFFELDANYTWLKPDLLEFAERHLAGQKESGERYLNAYINDFDTEFEALARQQGYRRAEPYDRPMSQFVIRQPFCPEINLAHGFRVISLADENDLLKIHRVLWRGFNHPGEPPDGGMEERALMQSGPHFRKDLTMVVKAPNDDYVVFCGLWYEAHNQFAYVEPVATDPSFRRMGLAKAAILEGIKRCAELGARVAYVGSDLEFYQALGFKKIFTSNCWGKSWKD